VLARRGLVAERVPAVLPLAQVAQVPQVVLPVVPQVVVPVVALAVVQVVVPVVPSSVAVARASVAVAREKNCSPSSCRPTHLSMPRFPRVRLSSIAGQQPRRWRPS